MTTFKSSDYVYPRIRPWREIFDDLKNAGCGQSTLSYLVGRKQSTVQYWIYEAKDLPDSVARSVLLLHMRYCGPQQTEIRLQQEKLED